MCGFNQVSDKAIIGMWVDVSVRYSSVRFGIFQKLLLLGLGSMPWIFSMMRLFVEWLFAFGA